MRRVTGSTCCRSVHVSSVQLVCCERTAAVISFNATDLLRVFSGSPSGLTEPVSGSIVVNMHLRRTRNTNWTRVLQCNIETTHLLCVWRGGAMVGRRTCNQEVAREFDPRPQCSCVRLWASCLHPFASSPTVLVNITESLNRLPLPLLCVGLSTF